MEDSARFTSGATAEILGLPHPTLRTWQGHGHVRFEQQPGGWTHFTEAQVIDAGVLVALIEQGLSVSDAAGVVRRLMFKAEWEDTIQDFRAGKDPVVYTAVTWRGGLIKAVNVVKGSDAVKSRALATTPGAWEVLHPIGWAIRRTVTAIREAMETGA